MHFLVKWIKFSVKKKQNIKKILGNGKKYLKSQGILSVRKSENPAQMYVAFSGNGGRVKDIC